MIRATTKPWLPCATGFAGSRCCRLLKDGERHSPGAADQEFGMLVGERQIEAAVTEVIA